MRIAVSAGWFTCGGMLAIVIINGSRVDQWLEFIVLFMTCFYFELDLQSEKNKL